MTMLFWIVSEKSPAQKISLDRAEVVELTKLAEKSSFLIGENRSLKVQLANAKDTVEARNRVISDLNAAIREIEQKNHDLSEDLSQKSNILKAIYWILGIAAVGTVGLKIYKLFN